MLDQYVRLLKNGEIVAFPTETVYGLGADAWNAEAIRKVFAQKGRPADNPLIVHINAISMAHRFARKIPDEAQTLMEHFWPGPLTLILQKEPTVLDLITAGMPTVALRYPRNPLAQRLIAKAGPLVAPSANSSGRPSPTRPKHIDDDFGPNFPVIDGGSTDIGLESTVLDVTSSPYKVYRPGKVSRSEIHQSINTKVTMASPQQGASKSPGTKYTHYTPDAKVRWLKEKEKPLNPKTLYLLHSFSPADNFHHIIHYAGDYNQMARELYDRFRQADYDGYQTVAVEPFPPEQVNPMIPALKNRINKAIGR